MIDAGKTIQQSFEKHGVTKRKGLTDEPAGVVAVVLVEALPNFDESRWGIHHLFAGKSITGKNRSMFTSRSQFCRRAVIWGAALDSKH